MPSVIILLNNTLCIVCRHIVVVRSMYMYYDLWTVLYRFMDIIAYSVYIYYCIMLLV